jgi:hypothetical protein
MAENHFVNFITFQIWALGLVVGAVVSVVTGNPLWINVGLWGGLIVGFAANEVAPGNITNGVRIR